MQSYLALTTPAAMTTISARKIPVSTINVKLWTFQPLSALRRILPQSLLSLPRILRRILPQGLPRQSVPQRPAANLLQHVAIQLSAAPV
jgi:hypothetical protein